MIFRIFSYLLGLCTIGVVVLVLAAGYGYYRFVGDGPLQEQKTVLIRKGSSLSSVAAVLENEGVIRSAFVFKLFGRMMGLSSDLKVGEYEFLPQMSGLDVMDRISSGKVVVHKFIVPEGTTSAEVVAMLDGIGILTGTVGDYVAEGSLLPETYFYSYGDSRNDIIARMQAAMTRELDRMWEERSPGLPVKTKEEAVILASIVEKETGVPGERDLVASVFINRLKARMRLQSDPTVIYAFNLTRPLYTKDLQTPHPYNTYRNYGLPPGPICNPGTESIHAVLNPAQTTYLYFVADGTGGHVFATNLKDHNSNVSRWRQINKK